ncbi:hypothetical protein SAMN05216436_109152 [bacterium A37T11]|nr:hypothetical protein SAMN05216436_109152 [bacterium A37T11]
MDTHAQVREHTESYDIGDMIHQLISPNKHSDSTKKPSGITPMPSVDYNPSIGFQIGSKAVAGKILGSEPETLMSVAAASASVTTKGILYFYLSHNVYTPRNKWNWQGNLVVARSVLADFGLGIGHQARNTATDRVLTNPQRMPYIQRAVYYSLREKVYKQVTHNLYLGAGVSFDIRRIIRDEAKKEGENKGPTDDDLTPYKLYNEKYGFDQREYQANGFLFNAQFTSMDHQNQAFKGIYSDLGIRINQSWMGSSKNSVQLTTDFRKYWSLSAQNQSHVLAFWNWGSYLLSGSLPYPELAGSGKDNNNRSARGYVLGYFRAPLYCYSEVEYRFPILSNHFLSGVTFFNVQTANDGLGTKLFSKWQPGGGAGLRVLFNKDTRTNLCLDYAFGNYGSHGFFLGLNEAF